jgi:hypothetical protein
MPIAATLGSHVVVGQNDAAASNSRRFFPLLKCFLGLFPGYFRRVAALPFLFGPGLRCLRA